MGSEPHCAGTLDLPSKSPASCTFEPCRDCRFKSRIFPGFLSLEHMNPFSSISLKAGKGPYFPHLLQTEKRILSSCSTRLRPPATIHQPDSVTKPCSWVTLKCCISSMSQLGSRWACGTPSSRHMVSFITLHFSHSLTAQQNGRES